MKKGMFHYYYSPFSTLLVYFNFMLFYIFIFIYVFQEKQARDGGVAVEGNKRGKRRSEREMHTAFKIF